MPDFTGMTKTVYLAGPMAGCTDEQCIDWRLEAKAVLINNGFEIRNPMVRDYRDIELSADPTQVQIIVDGDKGDIDESDIVLANCPFPSVGTSMEVIYAFERAKEVIVICEKPSPWLVYHSDAVVSSLWNALNLLIRKYT